MRDYDHGRVRASNRLWAPKGRFRWFSASKPHARLGRAAYDRSTLAAYFRARARAHERIELTEIAAGFDAERNIVHFAGKLVRDADDMRPKRLDFKGAADCVSARPTLIVWSM